MILNDNEFAHRQDDGQVDEKAKPNAYRVDDEQGTEEKDLERSFVYEEDKHRTGLEGTPSGGEKFGKNNLTPSGDDKNNPSQNAGYTNAYFRRTEPSDEHPEDSNFTGANQNGSPDYDKAQTKTSFTNETPKPDLVERGNGENDRPHTQEGFNEGTDDSDGSSEINIPGPEELPDQQKVGEPDPGNADENDHIET